MLRNKTYSIAVFPSFGMETETISETANKMQTYLNRLFGANTWNVVVQVEYGMVCEHCQGDPYPDDLGRPTCCEKAAEEWDAVQGH